MPPRRGGPTPYVRLDTAIKARDGRRVAELMAHGLSVRAAAETLGMSATTAWRRYWWLQDWTLPGSYGLPLGAPPPMRGTRACPHGRPCRPTLDHPEIAAIPSVLCGATRKDGQRCRAWAISGGWVCRMHGGAAPAVRGAALERLAQSREAAAVSRQWHRAFCLQGGTARRSHGSGSRPETAGGSTPPRPVVEPIDAPSVGGSAVAGYRYQRTTTAAAEGGYGGDDCHRDVDDIYGYGAAW